MQQTLGRNAPQLGKPRAERRLGTSRMASQRRRVRNCGLRNRAGQEVGGGHPGQKELTCKDREVRLLEPRAWAWARVGERRGGRGTTLFMAGAQREPRGAW